MALLRDDKVTVRRGGLTTARYREVMITPVGPGLTDEQVAFVDRSLLQAGATFMVKLPRLVTRLGAPATGPTDVPAPTAFDPSAPFKRFVSQLLALRLRRMIEADLAVRGGDLAAVHQLSAQATQLRNELTALSALLDGDWVEDLYDELGWVIPEPDAEEQATRDRLAARLRSERYLTLLERLVGAVRTPKLADPRPRPAGVVLDEVVASTVDRLRRAADRLSPDSADDGWEAAWQEMCRLRRLDEVVSLLLPEDAARLERTFAVPRSLLAEIHQSGEDELEATRQVAGLPAEEAFAAGREFERRSRQALRARRRFVKSWTKTKRKLPG